MTIKVVGPKEIPPNEVLKERNIINTTSMVRSPFSPFLLGPVGLWGGYYAEIMENGWQYSKVYFEHINNNGLPSENWFKWAKTGWKQDKANRYPMGKGATPLYSYWDGKTYGYTTARKKIFIPLYKKAVFECANSSFKKLIEKLKRNGTLTLWDFDGYDYIKEGKTLNDVIEDPLKTMGHAFVLAIMLIDAIQGEN
jgi:hypothetical protein